MKVIFDTNIWISFLFGQYIAVLKEVLDDSNVEIYVSNALLNEIRDVASRPKISRYVSDDRVSSLMEVIEERCKMVNNYRTVESDIRDSKDLYLISMAQAIPADYLVTGDKDLLVLIQSGVCKILTFSQFIDLFHQHK